MNILSRIRKAFKNFEKKVEGFFLKIEEAIDEVFFGKHQEKEVKKPEEEEEGKPVTLTVSTELYVGNHVEKIDITKEFPSREEALQNVESLAIQVLNENKNRASSIAKAVSYRIDSLPEEKYPSRVIADVVHKQKK
jgi:hypothetical protein